MKVRTHILFGTCKYMFYTLLFCDTFVYFTIMVRYYNNGGADLLESDNPPFFFAA